MGDWGIGGLGDWLTRQLVNWEHLGTGYSFLRISGKKTMTKITFGHDIRQAGSIDNEVILLGLLFAKLQNHKIMFFKLSVAGVVFRFYLMMAVVVAAGFLGQWWLTVLALPIFLSIMMGVTFGKKKENKINKAPMVPVKGADQVGKKAS